MVDSSLIESADVLENELEDAFEASCWELKGEDGLKVEGTLDPFKFD